MVGGSLFIIAFLLALWAIVTIRKAGTQISIDKPTTMIVTDGPFGFTRNPIYLGMLLGQAGLAVAFDTVWLLVAWAPLYLVLRYGVISREEAYLDRKFAALRAHTSQTTDLINHLGPERYRRWWSTESFVHAYRRQDRDAAA